MLIQDKIFKKSWKLRYLLVLFVASFTILVAKESRAKQLGASERMLQTLNSETSPNPSSQKSNMGVLGTYIIFFILLLGLLIGRHLGVFLQLVFAIGILAFQAWQTYITDPLSNLLETIGLARGNVFSILVMCIVIFIFEYLFLLFYRVCMGIWKILFFVRPLDRFLGGMLGQIQAGIFIGVGILLLEQAGFKLSDNVLFYREFHYIGEKFLALLPSITIGNLIKFPK